MTPLSCLPCLLPLPSSAYFYPTFASTTVTFNSKPSSHSTYLNKVVSSRQLGCRMQSCYHMKCTPFCTATRCSQRQGECLPHDDCGVVQSRACCLQDQVTVLGLLGRARVGFIGLGSELSYHSQMKSKKNGMHVGKGPWRCISPGEVICSPLSSMPSSQRASHFPRLSGMPHSASTTIESNISFVAASRNSGCV